MSRVSPIRSTPQIESVKTAAGLLDDTDRTFLKGQAQGFAGQKI
jgi:hypothetical protein